jgi:hypothetical protein
VDCGVWGALIVKRNEQKGIMRKLVGCERCLFLQTSVLDFLKPYSGTRASPHVLLDTGTDAADGLSAVQQEVSPRQVVIILSLFKFFKNINKCLFLAQNMLHGTAIPVLILRLWEICVDLRGRF